MLKFARRFRQQDEGAVTVDWVVLTAAIVGLGIATLENHLILFVVNSAALVKELGNILNGQHEFVRFLVSRSTIRMTAFLKLFFVTI